MFKCGWIIDILEFQRWISYFHWIIIELDSHNLDRIGNDFLFREEFHRMNGGSPGRKMMA